jgi:response regulator RpfG family c-di-GMP phosphodiesterase
MIERDSVLKKSRILIVDDEPSILQTLQQVLANSYEVDVAENGIHGIARLQEAEYDLLLTDLKMPEVDGVQLMEWAKRLYPDIEVIMITGFSDISLAVKIVRKGAYTYITKPFKLADIHLNVKRALEKRKADLDRRLLLQKQRELEAELLREEERRRVQEETVVQNISALIKALEGKDTYTRGHSERVTIYARGLARYLKLPVEQRVLVERSAKLHDIGKIGIRDNVLQKPGRLTPQEYAEIQLHPSLGAEIIRPISFLHDTIEGIGHHHESYDGFGYPRGLKGKDIPYVARVLAVADTYDAMTSTRAYRVKLSREIAVNELLRCSQLPHDQDLLFRHRKQELLDQIHLVRVQLEKDFLLTRVMGGASPRIRQRLDTEEDYRAELRDLLPKDGALRQQYDELLARIEEMTHLVRDSLEFEEEVFSRLAAGLHRLQGNGIAEEVSRFGEAIRKEAQFCLVYQLAPRMQFDPSIVATFQEYVSTEPTLEADIPAAYLPV